MLDSRSTIIGGSTPPEESLMTRSALFVLIALSLARPGASVDAKPQKPAEAKAKRPTLDVRATPRMGFSPANVLLVAELKGGDDTEEYYCPEIEWDWDDGGKSVHENDCPPFEEGKTKIERRFSAEHEFKLSGVYTVKATFRRAGRNFLAGTVRVTLRPGLGEGSRQPEGQP
jgi:hypothetical protein